MRHQRTWEAREDPSYDLVLETKDRKFHVHSVFLAAHYPVFECMFKYDFAERRERRVEISDVNSSQIDAFFQQVCGQWNLSIRNIPLFFPVAHKYMATSLMRNAVHWLKDYVTGAYHHDQPSDVIECVRGVTEYLNAEDTPNGVASS